MQIVLFLQTMKFISIIVISVFFIVIVASNTEQDEDDSNVGQYYSYSSDFTKVRCGGTMSCCYVNTRCCMQNMGCCKGRRQISKAFPCKLD
ncbi:unnamed protein product [Nezara viridula]|uniref:Uncharacterized protein n=1 Tax=Nezara viridula TaxID=85310 RepID=A0A9P0E8C9_NEZVI|nr:unnamed protein product [Nezara viridula]